MKKSKYVLHSYTSIPDVEEYTSFSSLIDCLLFAYNKCFDFSIYFVSSQHEFIFKISSILDLFSDYVFETVYDQYFLGFVSLILTTKERDIFKKKLRSCKNV